MITINRLQTWNDGGEFENLLTPYEAPRVALRSLPQGKGSGGGGQPQQMTSTVNQSNLPEYARPYFEAMMMRAQQVSNDPYVPYTGERLAGFNPQQQQAFNMAGANVGNYQPYFNQAQQNITQAGQFSPETMRNTYQATGFNPASWNDAGVASAYMSPYMQNVTNIAKREAIRDYGMQEIGRDTAAAQAGAFGGYRHGLVEAEADRNLNQQLQDIQNTGLQSAFMAGQGQFNTQQQQQLAANQLNNQFAQQESQLGMAAAGANNQYGLAAAQLGLTSGQALAGLGQAQQQAGLTDVQSLINTGAMQQAQQQAGLDIAYQDFLNQRDYPRQNLTWLSSILRGVPVSANTNVTGYQAPPSQISQIAGLGLGAAGLARLLS